MAFDNKNTIRIAVPVVNMFQTPCDCPKVTRASTTKVSTAHLIVWLGESSAGLSFFQRTKLCMLGIMTAAAGSKTFIGFGGMSYCPGMNAGAMSDGHECSPGLKPPKWNVLSSFGEQRRWARNPWLARRGAK